MTKIFCDSCSEEILSANSPERFGMVKLNTCDGEVEIVATSRTAINVDVHICLYCRLRALNYLDTRPVPTNPPVIVLSPAEIHSKHNRVQWAEGLIQQMPDKHEGANSWLLNYGVGNRANQVRDKYRANNLGHSLTWDKRTSCIVINKI